MIDENIFISIPTRENCQKSRADVAPLLPPEFYDYIKRLFGRHSHQIIVKNSKVVTVCCGKSSRNN